MPKQKNNYVLFFFDFFLVLNVMRISSNCKLNFFLFEGIVKLTNKTCNLDIHTA